MDNCVRMPRLAGACSRCLIVGPHTPPPAPPAVYFYDCNSGTHLQREEGDVGAVARGTRKNVLDVLAGPQRRVAVLLPIQLRLLVKPRLAQLHRLHLQHYQRIARLRSAAPARTTVSWDNGQ